MIYVDILEYLHGHQPFENVLEDVFEDVLELAPRPQIDVCDGPYAVCHPMSCGRAFKPIGEMNVVMGLHSFCE